MTLTTDGNNLCAMVNPFASLKEILILELLDKHGPMYGLEMVRASNGKLKRGTAYVVLGRLEERDLVTSKEMPVNHPGLPRPQYSLTSAGRQMLKAWRAVNQTTESRK